MRTIRSLTLLLGLVLSLLVQAAPASAAATYSLRWPEPFPFLVHKDDKHTVNWSKSTASAPDLARASAGNSACSVKTAQGAFGTVRHVVRGVVTNNRATQECPVTIQGGTNTNWSPSPLTIKHPYHAVNYEPIRFSELPFGNGSWCVSRCNFQAGVINSIIRDRSSGWCTEIVIGIDDNGRSGGTGRLVSCPHNIKLTMKKSYAAGKNFTIQASSNLGLDVTVASSTSTKCKVKDTDSAKNHEIRGISKGTCKLAASRGGSSQYRNGVQMYGPASASGSTKITGSCKKDCDVEPQDQTITLDTPSSVPELSVIQIAPSATSGLPVSIDVLTENRCMYDPGTRELQFQPYIVAPDAADPNLQNICRLVATQPGDDNWAAEEVTREIAITCSDVTCPPDVSPPPVAVADNPSFEYSDAGSYTGQTRGNDEVTVANGTFTRVISGPNSGSLTMNPVTGEFVFTPRSGFFVGPTTFTYDLYDTKGSQSSVVTVTITVVAPTAPPPPPPPSTSVTVQSGRWMRLNTVETVSAVPAGNCGSVALVNAICGTHPDAGGIVGSYNRFVTTSLTAFTVTPPAGYPSNRWSIVQQPTVGTNAAVFSTGIPAKLRFQQATTTSGTFAIRFGVSLSWESVQWTRYNGELTETVVNRGVTYSSASKNVGVVGSTR